MASSNAQQCSDYDFDAADEALTAEFRHRIGLLPEEEQDLSEAFKRRLGLNDDANCEVSEITLSQDVERDATLSKSKFDKFVKAYYQSKNANTFYSEPLSQPLLAKKSDVDRLVSLTVSVAVKRYCGDVPLPTTSGGPSKVSVMTSVLSMIENLNRRLVDPTRRESTSSESSNSKKHPFKKLLKGDSSKEVKTKEGSLSSDNPELDYATSMIPAGELELVQFIVGVGIIRRDLRDEIYCQLCAQVTKNPSAESCSKGWFLHTFCAACFLPSQQLLKHYFVFLNEASADAKDAVAWVRRTIHRTSAMGSRYHPPNCIEFKSVTSRKIVMLPVQLSDGRTETIEADSAMTAGEMCRQISASIKLKDQFGFAIYISIYDKVSSLGQGADHVMDAVSECEQLVRSEGGREEDAPWQLFFRKEIFTPWHDAEFDDVASELIYRQIVHGVFTSEYRLRSEDEIVRFIARRWFVEHGDELIPGRLQASLHEMLPQSVLASGKSRDHWTQAVMAAFEKMGFAANKYTRTKVKWSIVESGKRKWPLHFSGLFEAQCVSGLSLPKNDVVLAISCRGLFVLEEPYKVFIGLHYYELVDVVCIRNIKDRGPGLTIITVKGEQWTFLSPNSETITKLLCTFLDGLRRRSRWAVAIQDFLLQDHTKAASSPNAGAFRLRQGDVVELMDEMQQEALKDDWMYGRCERSGLSAPFPFDCVYIIPTCEKPPPDFMAMFTNMSRSYVNTLPRKRATVVLSKQTIGRYTGHGLQSSI